MAMTCRFRACFSNNTTFVTSTGPTKDPNFHLKARSARIGANFEWPDIASKLTLTGRLEGDFEGNFTEVDNRDVSSIRSSQFSIRQAWVRMDYAASDKTDIFFEGGQDWTLFGSSALPNLLETTALGYWYGDIYERSPQFQVGFVRKLGGSRQFQNCAHVCDHDADQQPDRKAWNSGSDGPTRSGRA